MIQLVTKILGEIFALDGSDSIYKNAVIELPFGKNDIIKWDVVISEEFEFSRLSKSISPQDLHLIINDLNLEQNELTFDWGDERGLKTYFNLIKMNSGESEMVIIFSIGEINHTRYALYVDGAWLLESVPGPKL